MNAAGFVVKGPLGGLPFIGFDGSEALVEGEGLLDEFEPLDDIFVANAIGLFDRVEAFVHGRKLAANFPQLWGEKILDYLPSFVYNAHRKYHPSYEVYTCSDVSRKK